MAMWVTAVVAVAPCQCFTPGPIHTTSPGLISSTGPASRCTHPLGQTLIVTGGFGWVQQEGGPVEEIRPGDVVWIGPGLKHWHGATAATAMTHVAIQEKLNGSPVTWMEKVTDEQYRK